MSRHPAADAALLARAERFGDEVGAEKPAVNRAVDVLRRHKFLEHELDLCRCGFEGDAYEHRQHVAEQLAVAGLLVP